MSSEARSSEPVEERVPYELIDIAAKARWWTLVGAGVLVAGDVAALLGGSLRWLLMFVLAVAGWVIALVVHVVVSTQVGPAVHQRGTGILTCLVGGTGLGPTARVHALVAAAPSLPEAVRVRAERAWWVCRSGARVTTGLSVLAWVVVALSLAWVANEAGQDDPADWYFLAPLVVAVFSGVVVLGINGLVAMVCCLVTPSDD